jgi:predicted alpha-1,2-mannosidase
MRLGRAVRLILALLLPIPSGLLCAQKTLGPYDAVNPFIGTSGGGNTFPGATLPFGMVQWSPDTNTDAWYKFDEKAIRGFSLTHISGAGCPMYGDFGVLPVTSGLTNSPGKDFSPYAVVFDHSKETAQPGYYAVTLANGVRVEITVTERAGIARFTFPAGTSARLLINASSSANEIVDGSNGKVASDNYENQIALTGTDSFSGWSRAGHFCSTDSHYKVYAAGQFNKPYRASAIWQDNAIRAGAKSAQGKHTGAWLDFGDQHEILLKVGISFVSEDGARENQAREIHGGWDFDRVHAAAKSVWASLLDRFDVQGGSAEQRAIFYTGVYHSFLSPNIFSDLDGKYAGFDGKVHLIEPHQGAQYDNFSDWDIYRNTVQLQALFFPEAASAMMQSLVNDAEQGGQLPRWEAANDVTYVMGGDSPVPVIASSYAFGARNFDAETALKHMVKASSELEKNNERPFLTDYLKLGYVASERDRTSASRTLEYASDDFSISQFAKSLGHADIEERFLKQSQTWKSLLDPETKMIRPRLADGTWLAGFDVEGSLPKANGSDQQGFEEGNTYQYTFMIPFDYPALFAAMGGEDQATPRLDHFFVKLRCWGEPCYNIENEPDFVVPYAYVFAGQPWKTQDVVTRIGKETFKATPDGIPGNDDLGATSGVYVWNALGMYPAVPGVGALVLGTPMFSKATLKMAGGRTLVVTRKGDGIYVTDVSLDGTPYPTNWLPISKLHTGATRVEFTTQGEADKKRGTKMEDRPPTFH